LPVFSSDIIGSIGLLGRDYLGYYPVEDTDALRALMLKAESDKGFLPRLLEQAEPLKKDFTEAAEYEGWKRLLKKII